VGRVLSFEKTVRDADLWADGEGYIAAGDNASLLRTLRSQRPRAR